MAIFRKIHTSFWSDSFISELDNDQKLFYLYLMTNERTKQCGVYEITKKQISFDLGYSIDKVSKLLQYFISTGKIKFNDKTNELALGNWLKYNSSTSPKVQSCINQEFSKVKDTVLIEYVKSMDTQSQEEEEKEEEQKQEKEEVKDIIDYLNLVCKTNFKYSKNSTKHINARLNDGFSPDELKDVIEFKFKQWGNDSKMSEYLRPETLFGSKFESYLNASKVKISSNVIDLTKFNFNH